MNYEITEKTELPEEGPTQVVKYTVLVEKPDGSKRKRGFNLNPSQDIKPHIEQMMKEIRAEDG